MNQKKVKFELSWISTEGLNSIAISASQALDEESKERFLKDWSKCKNDALRIAFLRREISEDIEVFGSIGTRDITVETIDLFRELLPEEKNVSSLRDTEHESTESEESKIVAHTLWERVRNRKSKIGTKQKLKDRRTAAGVFSIIEQLRNSAAAGRLKLGLIFMALGVTFLLSNIYVLPIMAEEFSAQAESPLKQSVDNLQELISEFSNNVNIPDNLLKNDGLVSSNLKNLNEGFRSFFNTMRRLDRDFLKNPLAIEKEGSLNPKGTAHPYFSDLKNVTDALALNLKLKANGELLSNVSDFGNEEEQKEPSQEKKKESFNKELTLAAFFSETSDHPTAAAIIKGAPSTNITDPAFIVIPKTTGISPPVQGYLNQYSEAKKEYLHAFSSNDKELSSKYENLKKSVENLADYGWAKTLDFDVIPISVAVKYSNNDTQIFDPEQKHSKVIKLVDIAGALNINYEEYITASNALLTKIAQHSGENTQSSLVETIKNANKGFRELTAFGAEWGRLQSEVEKTISNLKKGESLQDSFQEFIPPYAYLVLAFSAMFLTFGLSSVVRWARMRDEHIDDTRAIWKAGTMAEAAAIAANADIDPSEFVKGAAQFGNISGAKIDQVLNTPILSTAKEGFEIIKATSKKN